VAEGFRTHLGLSELYLADLDAIAGLRPNLDVCRRLHKKGFRLWVDAGIRGYLDVGDLIAIHTERVIVGLETLEFPEKMMEICGVWRPDRIVFSLDLLPGYPLNEETRNIVAGQAVAAGIRSLIVLNLERVGMGQGTGTEDLCRDLAARYPDVEILAGGGIRSVQDLLDLRRDGVRGALIASAFHDGRIRREDLTALQQ
jgi:phosphoribosylformimino-5-aminoimidazole carboxamide ribotide isomerase